MRISREAFLLRLESVLPGTSTREPVEQANCFAFHDGKVFTYNDETTCCSPSDLDPNFHGAVRAEKFAEMIRKLPTDEIDIDFVEGEVVVKSKKRVARFVMERDIQLPIDKIEEPEKWRKIPDQFLDAITMVGKCTSTAANKFISSVIHIHPEWIEGGDGWQVCRWPMNTKVKESNLVRYDAIKQIAHFGMTEWGQTKGWMHFRTDTKLSLACRRYLEDYPELDGFFKEEGKKITLPKGLVESANLGNIFSSENDENRVKVELKSGKLKITAIGDSGKFYEPKNVEYDGPPLSFLIAPDILMDSVSQYQDYILTKNTLRVETGNYIYANCLSIEKEEEAAEEESSEE